MGKNRLQGNLQSVGIKGEKGFHVDLQADFYARHRLYDEASRKVWTIRAA